MYEPLGMERAEAGAAGAGAGAGEAGEERGGWGALALQALALVALAGALALAAALLREHLKAALYWVDAQPPGAVLLLCVALFTLVSFPLAVGYLLLILTCGYLFGILRGLATVLVSANFGVAVAHYTLKAMRSLLPLDRLLRSDTARALLKVIAGPQAFKIVFFARLTPIPFGLQNTIFAVSDIKGLGYHCATFLGLLPAQVINVYLGSTLRSMHDVLQESHLTGYVVFAFQVGIGIMLMLWVIQKARKELTLAIMEAELGREAMSTSSSSASVS